MQFKKADKDKSGALTFKEVQDLLERINIKLSRKYAKDLFNVCTRFLSNFVDNMYFNFTTSLQFHRLLM